MRLYFLLIDKIIFSIFSLMKRFKFMYGKLKKNKGRCNSVCDALKDNFPEVVK